MLTYLFYTSMTGSGDRAVSSILLAVRFIAFLYAYCTYHAYYKCKISVLFMEIIRKRSDLLVFTNFSSLCVLL
jgi:hypothetical protein